MKNYLMGQQDPCIKDILQRLENTKKILDKLSKNTKRTFNGERFIPDSELSSVLKISRRTLSEYRSAGILPYYLISGKILYKESDVQQMLEKAYKNSLCTLGAYTAQGRLVGIIRAVGDGASILFIQDIIVLPEFQRKGIGTDLLRAIIRRYPDVYQTELMTDNTDKTIAFYKSLGFTPATEFGCLGFMKLNT